VQAQRQEEDPAHEKETAYRALCESFPALLRSAGLVQAVAYLEAKGKGKDNEYSALLDHFQQHFRGLKLLDAEKQEELPAKITSENLSMPQYRYYSAIAFKVGHWHKRLAQALLRQREKRQAEVGA
jgi:CRISPR type III-B/RAMP module-associated protein Cmr5